MTWNLLKTTSERMECHPRACFQTIIQIIVFMLQDVLTCSQMAVLIASFVRVSGLPFFSSNGNGVFESLRAIVVSFNTNWKDLAHDMVLRAPARESCALLTGLLVVWDVNGRAVLAPQAFSKLLVSFPAMIMMIIVV